MEAVKYKALKWVIFSGLFLVVYFSSFISPLFIYCCSNEDMFVLQIIRDSGNMGIWTKDLKQKCGVKKQPQVSF
jgi:hypothetical protein